MSLDLAKYIENYPNFPKQGILFKDFLPLMRNGRAFHELVDKLAKFASDRHADVIVGPEARGFLIGPAMAYKLGIGFVPARKMGKLPSKHVSVSYSLEYNKSTLEMEANAIQPGQRVIIVDDLIATGGTAAAAVKLIQKLGGQVVGAAFVMELTSLHGRKLIEPVVSDQNILSLIQYK